MGNIKGRVVYIYGKRAVYKSTIREQDKGPVAVETMFVKLSLIWEMLGSDVHAPVWKSEER